MLIVQDKLVSDEIVEAEFACHLEACKGACCWEGDLGAPLESDELPILDAIFDAIQPYLSPAGIDAVKKQGRYTTGANQIFYTPLIDGGPCAYMTRNASGIAMCGIEQAYHAGAIAWKKPISCHLYPIRITRHSTTGSESLNYDRWDICSAACELGKRTKVPVYQFVKEAIIRKYGAAFYEELDAAAQYWKNIALHNDSNAAEWHPGSEDDFFRSDASP